MRNESDYRLFKLVNFVIALLVLYGTHGVAFAEDRRNGGSTPSAEGRTRGHRRPAGPRAIRLSDPRRLSSSRSARYIAVASPSSVGFVAMITSTSQASPRRASPRRPGQGARGP